MGIKVETCFGSDHKVYSRDGTDIGLTTGSHHSCRLEGCSGLRISVKWSDGTHTYPCSKGMSYEMDDDSWQIL